MSRFKVLEGFAYVEGEKYEKGSIVETNLDLEGMFVNKFQKLADGEGKKPKKPSKPDPVDEDEDEDDDDEDFVRTPKAPKKKPKKGFFEEA